MNVLHALLAQFAAQDVARPADARAARNVHQHDLLVIELGQRFNKLIHMQVLAGLGPAFVIGFKKTCIR